MHLEPNKLWYNSFIECKEHLKGLGVIHMNKAFYEKNKSGFAFLGGFITTYVIISLSIIITSLINDTVSLSFFSLELYTKVGEETTINRYNVGFLSVFIGLISIGLLKGYEGFKQSQDEEKK